MQIIQESKFSTFIIKYGFNQSKLIIVICEKGEDNLTRVLVYVDDIIIIRNNNLIDELKEAMNKEFNINYLVNLKYWELR